LMCMGNVVVAKAPPEKVWGAKEMVKEGKKFLDMAGLEKDEAERRKLFAAAIKDFDDAIKENPKYAMAHVLKAQALSELGKAPEANAAALNVMGIIPASPREWTWKGDAFIELRFVDEALRCYNKAIEMDPNLRDAWLGKEQALRDMGRSAEAEKCSIKIAQLREIEKAMKGIAPEGTG